MQQPSDEYFKYDFTRESVPLNYKHYIDDKYMAEHYNVCAEYEFLGKKFIRYCVDCDKPITMPNGNTYKKGDVVWLETAPIEWIITKGADNSKKLLVAKNSLLSVNIKKEDVNKGINFEATELYDFLNNVILADMFQEKDVMEKDDYNIKITDHEKLKTISNLIKKIKKIASKYSNNTDIMNLIRVYINDFNNGISKLKSKEKQDVINSIKNSNKISLELNSEIVENDDYLYSDLKDKLNKLLLKIENIQDNTLEYYKIIECIDKCININDDISLDEAIKN